MKTLLKYGLTIILTVIMTTMVIKVTYLDNLKTKVVTIESPPTTKTIAVKQPVIPNNTPTTYELNGSFHVEGHSDVNLVDGLVVNVTDGENSFVTKLINNKFKLTVPYLNNGIYEIELCDPYGYAVTTTYCRVNESCDSIFPTKDLHNDSLEAILLGNATSKYNLGRN